MELRMVEVNSSNLKAIGYDAANHFLYVTFLTNRTYRYHKVPPCVWELLQTATSKGSFFAAEIRDIFPNETLDSSDAG